MTRGPQFEYMDNGRNAFSPEDYNSKFLAKNDGSNSGEGKRVMCGEGARDPWVHKLAPMSVGWDTWWGHSASLCLSLLICKSGITVPYSQVVVTNKTPWEKCSAGCPAHARHPDKNWMNNQMNKWKSSSCGSQRIGLSIKNTKEEKAECLSLLTCALFFSGLGQGGPGPMPKGWLLWINGDTREVGDAVPKTTPSHRIVLCLQKFQNFKYSSLKMLILILKQLPYFQFGNDTCCSLGPLQETRPRRFLSAACEFVQPCPHLILPSALLNYPLLVTTQGLGRGGRAPQSHILQTWQVTFSQALSWRKSFERYSYNYFEELGFCSFFLPSPWFYLLCSPNSLGRCHRRWLAYL